ncbi:hypothetical protein EYF80_035809 [Liparis tanakae]|uniref:Uncharacterized protein n=1 Tax=Liparis tanakae TaxID=230148 RepID=A0A4Z2GL60_9TELE|nr:hypothetical protein EYF80_035809 [Liparis tanakae]
MAEMEMRLMVGVTSTWSTLRPRGSSGALAGSELVMAFASWRGTQIDKRSHDQSRAASRHLNCTDLQAAALDRHGAGEAGCMLVLPGPPLAPTSSTVVIPVTAISGDPSTTRTR